MATCIKIIGGCIGIAAGCIALAGALPCVPSPYAPLACPSGMAGSYIVTLPNTVSWGSCLNTLIPCSPSIASETATGDCAGGWNGPGGLGYTCRGGWVAPFAFTHTLLQNGIDAGCAAWIITLDWYGSTEAHTVTYVKRRTGASINDIVGTYSLKSITGSVGGIGGTCPGATADATITVSPAAAPADFGFGVLDPFGGA